MQNAVRGRNNSIDIFRYVCAALVVCTHVKAIADFSEVGNYFFNQIASRITVLYFFAVAGYYYIAGLEKGKKVFFKYFGKILVVYTAWSVIYAAFSYFLGNKELLAFLRGLPKKYFVLGCYYHLWFFPALLFSILATTVFYKLRLRRLLLPVSIALFLLGCLGSREYAIGNRIPVVSTIINLTSFTTIQRVLTMSFPFFVMGGLIRKTQDRVCSLSNRWLVGLSLFFAVAYTAEGFLTKATGLAITPHLGLMMYPLVFFLIQLFLKNPLPKREKMGKYARNMANFTYYSHPLIVELIMQPICAALHLPGGGTVFFIVLMGITGAIGWGITKADNRVLNCLVR